MNRIREVSEDDFVAVVQPGVITAALQNAVEAKRLYYPPDPASRSDCSIGGNIATNAGGPRCLKYGVTRDYVLGLEVVLPDGSIAKLGGRCHKNKTGFDLARFFVGSEGLLGIVTEATLKLLPKPPFRACVGAGFRSMRDAARAIRGIFKAGFLPSALEIADAFTLAAARERTGSRQFDGCNAHLIVEIDGQEKSTRSELRELQKLIGEFSPLFIQKGFGEVAVEKFWALRREVFLFAAGHRPDKTQQRHRRASGYARAAFQVCCSTAKETRYPRGLFRPCGRREHSRQPDDGRGRPGTGQAK